MKNRKTSFTDEELDDVLKKWKRKGAERAAAFVFIGSIPLAIATAFIPGSVTPGDFMGAAAYYCILCGLAAASI